MERRLVASVRQHLPVVSHNRKSHPIQFFDTFPWQLWFSDRVLYRIGKRVYFADAANHMPGSALAIAHMSGKPHYWWEYPDRIAAYLQPLTKLRALLPRARVFATDRHFDVINRDQKIVAKVVFTAFRVDNRREPVFLRTCSCLPVRGYTDEFRRVCKTLKESGFTPSRVQLLKEYFEYCGNWPKPYRVKPQLKLDPDHTALSATCTAIRALLSTARSNEKGIIGDLDTEFLHDYRVCIRSIRALLSQTSGIFPAEVEQRLKRGFSELGKKTNRMRDLDVYLLERSRYQKMVPAVLESGLDTMFRDFEQHRDGELAKLRRHLKSAAYRDHMKMLKRTLDRACQAQASAGDSQDIWQIACTRVSRQIRKISKLSGQLDHVTSDNTIHALRLQCKKLRYSLDFFSSLFSSTELAKIAKSLRRLQNILGEFNDLAVQQAALIDYYRNIKHSDPDLGLAVGVLIGAMHERQREVRVRVSQLFSEFNSDLTQESIDKLLQPVTENAALISP